MEKKKQKTEKRKYNSKYTDEYVTIRQLMCDLIIERLYESLPYKYWNESKYKKDYKLHIMQIHSLCKIYSEEALYNVLKKQVWIKSLFMKKIHSFLEKEESLIEKKEKLLSKQLDTYEQPKGSIVGGNSTNKIRTIGKFKSLDD